jgi:8-amino-7-oxononanoate synthase
MPNAGWNAAVADALMDRRDASAFRVRQSVVAVDATHVEVAGRRLVNFASNDYLGLTHHPRVVAAFTGTAGVGSGSAALVTGHTTDHAIAEAALARWKGTAAAVLLASGYAANAAAVGTLAAVGRRKGTVRFLIDKLSHASLVDAVRVATSAGCTYRVFPHNGLAKLRRLLAEADRDELQVVVTESIFSMDGDAADLPGLAELRERFGFALLLDEAHAAGVYGPAGSGLAAELSLSTSVDLSVVTLSKAVGVVGGAVCGSVDWVDAVVNFGRPYVFSTSLPPAVAAAATAAIGVMADEPDRQARVRRLARHVRDRLTAAGFSLPPGDSPIVPVVLGHASATLLAAERLRDAGFLVAAIRPPTVARGTSRLRMTLSCEHTDAEVEALLAAVTSITPPTASSA